MGAGGNLRSELTLAVTEGGRPLSEDAVDRWLAAARAGDELHYATGYLPSWAAGPKRVRALYDQGLVETVQARLDGLPQYFARRTSKPLPAMSGMPVVGSCADTARSDVEDECARLLKAIESYASGGYPCPTNARLAEIARIDGPLRVSDRLKVLRDSGRIAIIATSAQPRRQVTISATGMSTGIFKQTGEARA